MKTLIAWTCACVLAFTHSIGYSVDAEPGLQELIHAFSEAQRDHRKIHAAYVIAEKTTEALPNDPVALAYKGSLAVQVAGEEIYPWTKAFHLKKGLGWMDEALERAVNASVHSAVFEVRTIRALTTSRVPLIFGRESTAREDLKWILSDPLFKDLRKEDKAAAYSWRAVYAHRDQQTEKAQDYLRRASALDPVIANDIWSHK